MGFSETVAEILKNAPKPLTPQEIRDRIKAEFPNLYGTKSHSKNVSRGHYKDLDHALLAQIYITVRQSRTFACDKRIKPMHISLAVKPHIAAEVEKRNNIGTAAKTKLPDGKISQSARTIPCNEDALIENAGDYYSKSKDTHKSFGGPSIYFHNKAIEAQKQSFLSKRHLEMIYATLVSWGMHRMGDPRKTKAKMVDFEDFRSSILSHKNEYELLRDYRIEECTAAEYDEYLDLLSGPYHSLVVSISEATVVAHSKTLAHILPNLIPPIDRQYTVRFFTQEHQNFFTAAGKIRAVANLPVEKVDQFEAFKTYCRGIKRMIDKIDCAAIFEVTQPFNTSYPKIMDNLIMTFIKDVTNSRKE